MPNFRGWNKSHYKMFMLVSNDAMETPLSEPMNIHQMAKYLNRAEKSVRWSASESILRRNERNRTHEIKKHKDWEIISFWDDKDEDYDCT